MHVIEVENIKRTFTVTTGLTNRQKKELTALGGVNLAIEKGELFGLLGPNGAGKTTLTKILTTILLPSSGQARVLGYDVVNQQKEIRPQIGIVFGGERGLYWRLSGMENMEYFAALYKIPPAVAKQRIPHLLELVGLHNRAKERVEGYSRGMKQRLHIARGLVNDPDVIFLDEPTIGLDPVAARELRTVIKGLKDQGKTIFLTSHYMYEVDALCDRVAVLNKGEIITTGTPASLKSLVANLEVIDIECLGVPPETINQLRKHPDITAVNVEMHGQAQVIQIQASEGVKLVQTILKELDGVQVNKVVTRQPTLEDAYVKLVGQGALNA